MSTPTPVVQLGGSMNPPDTSQPPPSWQGPPRNEFGLTDLKPYFKDGAWTVLITCVAWCVHWQEIFDKVEMTVDMGKLNLFAGPFVGMGDPNVWPIYQQMVSTLLMSQAQDWFEESDEFRRENSLPWLVIRKLAPDLSQVSKGHKARLAVKDLLRGSLPVTFR